mmetsp:Transcript_40860/g.102893  ORF Transcript_40860/g.102893 Transcript_40860/m.102893 type:complete len:1012 (-) Transcript_40860:694-3729(-)
MSVKGKEEAVPGEGFDDGSALMDVGGDAESSGSHGRLWNYVVTAQKPTAVTHAVVGNFTHPSHLNLIICKTTRIEIHKLTAEGLMPMHDVNIYGRVACFQLFRPKGAQQDLLFLTTERYKFCILSYDAISGEIVTWANGSIQDRIGRSADIGQIGIVDPECRLFGLHIYDGLFKVIPLSEDGHLSMDAFNIRLNELQVIDIQFLHGCQKPTIAVLHQDSRDARHVRTYEISLSDKEFAEGPWFQYNVEGGASILIPVPEPMCGVLIVGEQSITYHGGAPGTVKSIQVKSTVIKAYGMVDTDGTRWLLGDFVGNLLLLVLQKDANHQLTDLKLEPLGKTSIPSSISYLDNGVVFVGSAFGDSQLIRLHAEPQEDDETFVEVLETVTNLGPIVDFTVVDLDGQGQGQVVTCSGAFNDGSLRLIRNGIGINEQASLDVPGVKGVWSMCANATPGAYHQFLCLTFIGITHFLALEDGEIGITSVPGFRTDTQTLYCGDACLNQMVQVTKDKVLLIDSKTRELVAQYAPPAGQSILVASGNLVQLLLVVGGRTVVCLEIGDKSLTFINNKEFDSEISCVDITSCSDAFRSEVCAIGFWDVSVGLFSIADWRLLATEELGGEAHPCSVLMTTIQSHAYLMCAVGDGHLFNFSLDTSAYALSDRKKLSVGSQPISLHKFVSKGEPCVFAACDRPTVVYSRNDKLLYSNVNLKMVHQIAPFHTESFPECLCVISENLLSIGSLDEIQKLHIRSIPLGEMPRRIAYESESRSFCVLTERITVGSFGDEMETAFIRLFDDRSFEALDSLPLKDFETGCSLISCNLEDVDTTLFVVGTAFALPNEPEPTRGRILVLRVVERKFVVVCETEVKGAVYSLNAFNGKVLAGVNSKIQLFIFEKDGEEVSGSLKIECGHLGHILALFVCSRGDFIVVGDLMKSMSLLRYRRLDGTIVEVARDYNPNWMTAIETLDDEAYIGAENSFNLFTLRRNTEDLNEEDRGRLITVGEYHLGEFVNKLHHGMC